MRCKLKKRKKLEKSLHHFIENQKVKNQKKKTDISAFAKIENRKKPAHKVPYGYQDQILLVGEANFSFTLSLRDILNKQLSDAIEKNPYILYDENYNEKPLGSITATSLDSESVALEKYPSFDLIRDTLLKSTENDLAISTNIFYEFDATKFEKSCLRKRLYNFDKIVFNFPHVGRGITDETYNIRANQKLIFDFLNSCKNYLTKPCLKMKNGGEVHITVKKGKPYDLWNVKALAKQCGFKVQTSFDFNPDLYPGYEHRRTIGFKEGISVGNNEEITKKGSRTWVFLLDRESVTSFSAGTKRARSDGSDSD